MHKSKVKDAHVEWRGLLLVEVHWVFADTWNTKTV